MSIIVASTFITLVYSVVIYLTVIDYKERLQLKNGLSASVNFVFDKLALIFLMPKKVRDENTSGVSDL
jgi:hypothetical protein